jgi:hypothetical protein
MRKIYLVDLGLLVAAGTLAFVLTNKPASSEPNDVQEEAAITAVPGVSATDPTAQEFSAEWVSYEDDDPGSP